MWTAFGFTIQLTEFFIRTTFLLATHKVRYEDNIFINNLHEFVKRTTFSLITHKACFEYIVFIDDSYILY